jgi:hypothetical protein
MERWDDFMMTYPVLAWTLLLLVIVPAFAAVPVLALMLWGTWGFCIASVCTIAFLGYQVFR